MCSLLDVLVGSCVIVKTPGAFHISGGLPCSNLPDSHLPSASTSSQALVDISTLEQALRLIKDTLQTLHLHIVSPRAAWHQLLHRISFCDFLCVHTLHAPLQLLVYKQEKVDGETMELHHSLPPTLRELWLNDDEAVLWLHHHDFITPYNIDWTLDYMWFGQRHHPIHSDGEIIHLVAEYLHDAPVRTPTLKSLKLLFHFFDSRAWGQRDAERIRDALLPYDGVNGVAVRTYELLKRSYRCQGGMKSLNTNGQYFPYFTKAMIQKGTKTDGHQREH